MSYDILFIWNILFAKVCIIGLIAKLNHSFENMFLIFYGVLTDTLGEILQGHFRRGGVTPLRRLKSDKEIPENLLRLFSKSLCPIKLL